MLAWLLQKPACISGFARRGPSYHPSGNLVPSVQDKQLTSKLREGGKLIDIKMIDHLIITREAYYSFADEGVL